MIRYQQYRWKSWNERAYTLHLEIKGYTSPWPVENEFDPSNRGNKTDRTSGGALSTSSMTTQSPFETACIRKHTYFMTRLESLAFTHILIFNKT